MAIEALVPGRTGPICYFAADLSAGVASDSAVPHALGYCATGSARAGANTEALARVS